ncbi:MAG: hypothetical protein JJ966_04460 [Balneolaceae bacterium]|nr:hypothetical protein [Balneolaceae bacterium]
MSNDRLYTEKEISKILKRAGEIQASEREKVTVGLSLEEIQHLAEEVGLEPDIIANVAETIDIDQEEESTGFFDSLLMPTKLNIDHIIQGEIKEEDWPEVITLMEQITGKGGASNKMGKLYEWICETNNTTQKLSMIPGEEQTKVIYNGSFAKLAMSWTIPIMVNVGFWVIFLGMLNWGLIGIPLGLAAVFISYLVILRGFKNYLRKKSRSVKNAFIKMKSLVSGKSATQEQSENRPKNYIEFPDAFDEMNTNEGLSRKRVR